MNSLHLIARLTRDPEVHATAAGRNVTTFGIAYDMGFGTHKHPVFLDCKLWGERGQHFATYVHKGHAVGLSGTLDMETWEDKQTGQKRTRHLMLVSDFTLLNNRREGHAAHAGSSAAKTSHTAQSEPGAGDDDDDEIPF